MCLSLLNCHKQLCTCRILDCSLLQALSTYLNLHAKIASVTMQITVLLWASAIKKTSKFSIKPLSWDNGGWFGPSRYSCATDMSCDMSNLRLSVTSLTATSFYAFIGKVSWPFTLASVKVTVTIFCRAFACCMHTWFSITAMWSMRRQWNGLVHLTQAILCWQSSIFWDETLSVPVWPGFFCVWNEQDIYPALSLSLQVSPRCIYQLMLGWVLVLHFIPNIFCGISTGWFTFFFPRQYMRHNYITEFNCIFARNVFD